MKNLLAGLTCCAMMLAPALQMSAQSAEPAQKVNQIHDVALGTNGTMRGMAVNGQGQPLSAAKVNVLRNNEVVSTTVTSAEGKFEVAGLSTGIYEVQAGQGRGTVRVWEGAVAPPTAKHNVLVVSGAAARAQAGLMVDPLDTVTLGLAITGTALGAIALSEDNETIIVSP